MQTANSLRELIRLTLEEDLKLEKVPANTLVALKSGAAFCDPSDVVFGKHFVPACDFIIHGADVRTIGLIQSIQPVEDGNTSRVEDAVEKAIEQATYIRHLILTDPGLQTKFPPTVELVLVTWEESSAQPCIAATLRTAARETVFLQSIGVSVLAAPFDAGKLRRAFPWLLQATRRWFETERYVAANRVNGKRKLSSLTLENFRLPGSREISFALEGDVLHLVHGHNGTGKSSLVEAIELACTGRIERISLSPEAPDYDQVLRYSGPHKRADTPATIRLRFEHATENERWFRIGEQQSEPLNPSIKAASFRLDQTLMDRLAGVDDARRAEVFLEAYFADNTEVIRRAVRARRKPLEVLSQLPASLRETVKVSVTSTERVPDPLKLLPLQPWMNAFAPDVTTLDSTAWQACLPLSPEVLGTLVPLATDLRGSLEIATSQELVPKDAAHRVLQTIDNALTRIASTLSTTRQHLHTASDALDQLRGWNPEASADDGEDFASLLNDWLEMTALADIADKQWQVYRALCDARQAGWECSRDGYHDFFSLDGIDADRLTRLETIKNNWIRKRDELRTRLSSAETQQITAESTEEMPADQARPHLANIQVSALNTAGAWLCAVTSDSSALPLGTQIQRVIAEGRAFSHALLDGSMITIGSGTWIDVLQSAIRQIDDGLKEFDCKRNADSSSGSWLLGTQRLAILQELWEAYKAAETADKELKGSFLVEIGLLRDEYAPESHSRAATLNEALNELMALFTPARWAYEDLTVAYSADLDRGSMHMQTGKHAAPAELRLNTAELNLFTIALFLLCAPRVENPLQLLILDDPLQNMDEMTVTSLARGLAKVVRCLPGCGSKHPWQLLLLFHGEEDLERFSRETPSVVYLLPWLSLEGTEQPHHVIVPDMQRQSRTNVVFPLSAIAEAKA